MKAWLKGGLIGFGLDFLFWLVMFLRLIWADLAGKLSDMGGLAAYGIIYYGGLSLIPAFIVGAIIGAVSGWIYNIEKKVITLWSKIGFLIGVVWPVLWYVFVSLKESFNLFVNLNFFLEIFKYPFIFAYLLSILGCAWLFWVIGAVVKKIRK